MVKVSKVETNVEGIRTGDGFYSKFKSSGNESLAVNGSGASVEFILEDLDDNQKIAITNISFLLDVDPTLVYDKFGSINVLTEGLQFYLGEEPIVIKDNIDISLVSGGFTTYSGKFNTLELFGNMIMTTKEALKIVINDNLTGLDYFKVACHGILIEEN